MLGQRQAAERELTVGTTDSLGSMPTAVCLKCANQGLSGRCEDYDDDCDAHSESRADDIRHSGVQKCSDILPEQRLAKVDGRGRCS